MTLIFFLIRLPYLDQLNLLHDERDISLSGYSISKTGKDLSGNFLPLTVTNIAPDNPITSIYYSAAAWLFTSQKNVFNARFPYVLISSLLIFLIYKLILIITKNRPLSYLTSLFCCFSPWLFHITRLGMDVTLAFPTLLIAILFQLKNKKIFSFIFYTLTFYNYQGFRPLIPVLIVFFTLVANQKKIILRALFINIIFIVALFTSSFLIDRNVTQARVTQVIFFNKILLDSKIVFNRNTSSASSLVKAVFDNKITESGNYILSAFIKGIDNTFLFKDGDYSAINGSISGGQFLIPTILFFYFGFIAFGRKFNRYDLVVLSFIPLGMIPSVLSTNGISFGIRGVFSSIGFSFVIARGFSLFYEVISKMQNIKFKNAIIVLVLISYMFGVLNFVYIYFFRRPILMGEIFNEHERKVSQFLMVNQGVTSRYVYTNNKESLERSFLFFNKFHSII